MLVKEFYSCYTWGWKEIFYLKLYLLEHEHAKIKLPTTPSEFAQECNLHEIVDNAGREGVVRQRAWRTNHRRCVEARYEKRCEEHPLRVVDIL